MILLKIQCVALEHGLILVDTKYEFGKDSDGSILLIDEVRCHFHEKIPCSLSLSLSYTHYTCKHVHSRVHIFLYAGMRIHSN